MDVLEASLINDAIEALVPIFICAGMPVCIVLIYFISVMKSEKHRAQVLVKALEVNPNIDVNELTKAFVKPRKTPEEIRNKRLLNACLFSLIGIMLIAIGIVALCSGSTLDDDSCSVPLLFGGISLAIGLSFLIVFFVTRPRSQSTKD